MSADDDRIECQICNGTGEGQHDGAACPACGGRGIQVDDDLQHEIEQQRAERQWEIQQYGY